MHSSLMFTLFILPGIILINNCVDSQNEKILHHAICIIKGKGITGQLRIRENPQGKVNIRGQIEGLAKGPHGMHVHKFGDISQACVNVGAHFDAHNSPVPHGGGHGHGHTGDLGNVIAGDDNVAKININDSLVALHGDNSIIGRAVLVHFGADDLGQSKDNTGHTGPPVACGVIAWDD